jgi:alpha-tubulin suppressor-like RCC1 family protein
LAYIWGDTLPGIEQPIFNPLHICPSQKFLKIALGHSHFLGINTERKVISFGINKNNCLGIENTNPNNITVVTHQNAIEIEFLQDVVDISASFFISAAINSVGRNVLFWGNNIDKFSKQKKNPATFSFQNKKLSSVSVGEDFMIVSTVDGQLLSCGNNSKNQLGRVSSNPIDFLLLPVDFGEEMKEKKFTTVRNSRLELEKISSVSYFDCSRFYSVAIRNGLVYIWGLIEELRHFPSRIEFPTIIHGTEDLETKYISCGEREITSIVGLKNLENIRFLSFKPPRGFYFIFFLVSYFKPIFLL